MNFFQEAHILHFELHIKLIYCHTFYKPVSKTTRLRSSETATCVDLNVINIFYLVILLRHTNNHCQENFGTESSKEQQAYIFM